MARARIQNKRCRRGSRKAGRRVNLERIPVREQGCNHKSGSSDGLTLKVVKSKNSGATPRAYKETLDLGFLGQGEGAEPRSPGNTKAHDQSNSS